MKEIPPEKIAYHVAYRLIPNLFFDQHLDFMHQINKHKTQMAKWLYEIACGTFETEPDPVIKSQYIAEIIDIRDGIIGCLITFPDPKPQDILNTKEDILKRIDDMIEGGKVILAPYFALPTLYMHLRKKEVFVLGQAPLIGSTLRKVTTEGLNMNLGWGLGPKKGLFIHQVRERILMEESLRYKREQNMKPN